MTTDTVGRMASGWWNWDGWPRADEWQAWWSFVAVLVTATAAAFAVGQLLAYIREQEERARPFLIVDFEFRSVLLYVTVENTSSTPAESVRLKANPIPRSTLNGRDAALERIFGGGLEISQVAPGRRMRWLLDNAPELFTRDDLPHRFEVQVDYVDPRVARRPRLFGRGATGIYHDRFVLDLDQYGEASADQDYDSKNWNIADRNERRLESLKKSGASIAESLHELAGAHSAARTRTARSRRIGRPRIR